MGNWMWLLIVVLVLIAGSILWAFLTYKPEKHAFFRGREVEIVNFSEVGGLAEVKYLDDGQQVVAHLRDVVIE